MTPSIHSAILSELRAVAAMMDEITAADPRALGDIIRRGSEWQTRRAGVEGAIILMESLETIATAHTDESRALEAELGMSAGKHLPSSVCRIAREAIVRLRSDRDTAVAKHAGLCRYAVARFGNDDPEADDDDAREAIKQASNDVLLIEPTARLCDQAIRDLASARADVERLRERVQAMAEVPCVETREGKRYPMRCFAKDKCSFCRARELLAALEGK